MLNAWFQKLSDISWLARTEAMLKDGLADAGHELGFDCYAYLHFQPVRTYAVSNYPPERQDRYLVRCIQVWRRSSDAIEDFDDDHLALDDRPRASSYHSSCDRSSSQQRACARDAKGDLCA
ncbi:hypothetical protein MESS2_1010015 [Mesorhizobium metallidurans STM 2683]|uniref:Transcription factor LuxR-like autoinducer-binding domain-containing protein n=1 Tax=Mesorhizobium metallidurans STM 2683 TaxID=1297569 RepID=M5EEJ9_9HYPH|nr:hypothetical protein [Mesorhizobium metallidurans]CCV03084.1 hypothetical protein MESS2_1010015 [Mesorhizobium metallidurans STM 2683]